MRSGVLFALLLLASACFTRSAYMTRDTYDNLSTGESVEDIRKKAGEPLEIKTLSNGRQEYLYVEKVMMGTEVIMENHYILVIANGTLISKKMTTQKPPAFNIIYQNNPSLLPP
jgi:outer membrane protein assembly factor BamE (lipoprotein component of BamABCDE complex)